MAERTHQVIGKEGLHTIEKHALRYVLRHVGDAATIQVHSLADGWRVEVYGVGMTEPAGILRYSLTGDLLPEQSTSPELIFLGVFAPLR